MQGSGAKPYVLQSFGHAYIIRGRCRLTVSRRRLRFHFSTTADALPLNDSSHGNSNAQWVSIGVT